MTLQNPAGKKWITAAGLLAVIAGASLWIYFHHFAAPQFNVTLHKAVGRVMAEETARLLNRHGKLVLIAIETPAGSELQIQLKEFEKALKAFSGMAIAKNYTLETDKKPKYGVGSGLSARRFIRIVNKNTTADAIVSFVGAPDLSDDEMRQLEAKPKFIAEARSAEKLKKLFDKQVLHAAVVSRFQFPSPVEGKPSSPRQWFDKRFQIITTENAASLPGAGAE